MSIEPVKWDLKAAFDAAFRLRRIVVSISERQPSHARSVIDQYLKFIAPSLAGSYGSDFPITCRRAATNPERSRVDTGGPGKWPLLYFHISNTILGYYDGLLGKPPEVFESRLKLLNGIAKFGLDDYVIDGDTLRGFVLITKDEMKAQMAAEDAARALSDAKQSE
jgi:hypothetical protein